MFRLSYVLDNKPARLHPRRFITSGEAIKAGERLQLAYDCRVSYVRVLEEYCILPNSQLHITKKGQRLVPHEINGIQYFTIQ